MACPDCAAARVALPAGMERGARPASGAMSEFEPVSYDYCQFYCVFALASMYVAMLMTGWGSDAVEKVSWFRGGCRENGRARAGGLERRAAAALCCAVHALAALPLPTPYL